MLNLSPVRGVLPIVYRIKRLKKQQRLGCSAIDNNQRPGNDQLDFRLCDSTTFRLFFA
jgi:hypothetical protein